MRKLTLLIAILSYFATISMGQKTPEVGHYFEFKENNVRDYCWESNDPYATDTVIPEQWRNESAVYLYFENYYETIRLKSKAFAISYIAHYRIKILDKSALEDLSEIYYSQYAHGNYALGYQAVGRQKNFLGIKVIKPNGKEIILKSDDFIEDDDGGKKVAVPNLEVGDIIDYYQYTYDYGRTYSYVINETFIIGGKYPIKHFKYQLLTNKHWDVMFTTGTVGPEIVEKKIGKKFYKFSVEGSDYNSASNVMWNYPFYNFPFIKLYVEHADNHLSDKENAKVLRTTKLDNEDIKEAYSSYYEQDKKAGNEYNSFLKYLKKNGKSNLTKEKKLEEYYYYLRHIFKNMHFIYDTYNNGMSKSNEFANQMGKELLGNYYGSVRLDDDGTRYISARQFSSHIIYALNKMNIRYELVVIPMRSYGQFENLLSLSETNYMVKARLKNPVYFYKPTAFTSYNDVPYTIEGVDAYSLYSPDKKVKNISVKKTTLPVSKASDNSTSQKMDISFNKDNPLALDIETHITYMGENMRIPIELYVDNFAMIWEENDRYDTKKWGDIDNSKDKIKVQMEEFTESREEDRKSNYESLASTLYDTEEIELGKYGNINTGNQPGDKNLQIEFDCTVEELVKKVGPNYIIKAGQLLGGQITLDEDDMEREIDIYMNYPRTYNYELNITIPEGYEVKGLDNFNYNIDNETGSLITSAKEVDGKILLSFTKVYKNNFEKVTNWELMKEFLIPASEFPSKEILLKKN